MLFAFVQRIFKIANFLVLGKIYLAPTKMPTEEIKSVTYSKTYWSTGGRVSNHSLIDSTWVVLGIIAIGLVVLFKIVEIVC